MDEESFKKHSVKCTLQLFLLMTGGYNPRSSDDIFFLTLKIRRVFLNSFNSFLDILFFKKLLPLSFL